MTALRDRIAEGLALLIPPKYLPAESADVLANMVAEHMASDAAVEAAASTAYAVAEGPDDPPWADLSQSRKKVLIARARVALAAAAAIGGRT